MWCLPSVGGRSWSLLPFVDAKRRLLGIALNRQLGSEWRQEARGGGCRLRKERFGGVLGQVLGGGKARPHATARGQLGAAELLAGFQKGQAPVSSPGTQCDLRARLATLGSLHTTTNYSACGKSGRCPPAELKLLFSLLLLLCMYLCTYHCAKRRHLLLRSLAASFNHAQAVVSLRAAGEDSELSLSLSL